MPPSSVAARSLAFALIGVGAASFAAHGQNVTAFNPYSGVGLPNGPIPQYVSPTTNQTVDTVGRGSMAGPAFNPWSSGGQASSGPAVAGPASAAPATAMSGVPQAYTPSVQAYDPGASLPPPPQGLIASRIVAVPELTTNRSKSRDARKAKITSVAPKPVPVAAVAPNAAPAAPTLAKPATKPEAPAVAKAAPAPTPRPAPPVGAAPTSPAAAPEQKMAALAPQPMAPARVPLAITLAFVPKSAELSDASKTELDGLIKKIADRNLRQVELRAFAGKGDSADRKISLARALIVRTYLIDKGVKSKIEIGTFPSSDGGERVDILLPNT